MSQQVHLVAPARKDRDGCVWFSVFPGISVMVAFEPPAKAKPVTLHRPRIVDPDA